MLLWRISLFICVFSSIVAASWTQQDFEIFDLVAALESSEGSNVSFYSFLNVTSSATTAEISRAYRKRSLELHPDKNPDVPKAHERFARLGVIANILKNEETRKRYHYFYVHGVPRWRGTAYLYSRYRPGLGAVLLFLALLTTATQHLLQRMTYNTRLKRILQIKESAKAAALKSKLQKSTSSSKSNKKNTKNNNDNTDNAGEEPIIKVRIPLNATTPSPNSDSSLSNIASLSSPNDSEEDMQKSASSRSARRAAKMAGEEIPSSVGGPLVTMEVQGNDVWMVDDQTGQAELVDESFLDKPTFTRTWIPRLSYSLFAYLTGKKQESNDEPAYTSVDSTEETGEDQQSSKSTSRTKSNGVSGITRKRRKRRGAIN